MCGAKCCRRPAFYVTQGEHRRLFSQFGLHPELETPEFIAKAETGGFLVLDRPCPHLDQKTNLCNVYFQRPASCRDFPYSVTPQCPLSETLYGPDLGPPSRFV